MLIRLYIDCSSRPWINYGLDVIDQSDIRSTDLAVSYTTELVLQVVYTLQLAADTITKK